MWSPCIPITDGTEAASRHRIQLHSGRPGLDVPRVVVRHPERGHLGMWAPRLQCTVAWFQERVQDPMPPAGEHFLWSPIHCAWFDTTISSRGTKNRKAYLEAARRERPPRTSLDG